MYVCVGGRGGSFRHRAADAPAPLLAGAQRHAVHAARRRGGAERRVVLSSSPFYTQQSVRTRKGRALPPVRRRAV